MVIYIDCNLTYMIYLLSSERPRMDALACLEEQAVGVRSREYRAAMTISKTGCVEVSGGRVLCRTGLLGLEGPSRERLKTAMNAANQPQLEECLSALGHRRGMAPEIWG